MQINSLPTSQITEAKPAVAVAPPPLKPAPAVKPLVKPSVAAPAKPSAAAPAANGTPTAVKDAAAATAGTKAEITDVKPAGENAEGDPTFTLKVNGKEYKATQSEIIALAQKARGAEVAMQQKAEVEKLAADLLSNFDADVYGLMVKRHGKEKADQMVIQMTKKLIAEEQKDPKDRELEQLRTEKQQLEDVQKKQKEAQELAARKVKQAQLYKTMLTEIDSALNETHLPKDKLTLTRVLNYLAAGKKANGTVWTIKDAVQAVEVEDMSHATHYARRFVEGKLPSEKFREIFGDEALKKLNKEQINILKNADKSAKNSPSVAPDQAPAGGEAPQKRVRSLSRTKGSDGMSEREYRRQHGSMGGL